MLKVENDFGSVEILRPLTDSEFDELFQLYKDRYGVKNFHYLLMYNQLKWNRQLSELNNEEKENWKKWISFRKIFYTHRDCDFRQYGTYVYLHHDLMQSVCFHSWEPNYRQLYDCIRKTKLINWESGPLLTNVELEYCEKIKEIALGKGVKVQRARLCYGLILEHHTALDLKNLPIIPAGYELRRLHENDAQQLHDLWVNNKEGSLQYVKNIINLSESLGIVRNSDQELVAWIVQNDYSGLGILQVQPEERCRGFGTLLATQLSKRIAKSEQVNISAWILAENYKSASLLGKIGFKKIVCNEWIQLKSADKDIVK